MHKRCNRYNSRENGRSDNEGKLAPPRARFMYFNDDYRPHECKNVSLLFFGGFRGNFVTIKSGDGFTNGTGGPGSKPVLNAAAVKLRMTAFQRDTIIRMRHLQQRGGNMN